MSRLTRWVHSRRDGAESGFAMMLSLFVMLIIVTVTLVIAALVTSQAKPTLLNQKFVRTVNGAQAGMQNTLAQLRAANDGLLAGDQIKLPCSDPDEASKYGGGGVSLTVGSPASTVTGLPGYPITGTVSGGGSANSIIGYSVSVVYFDTDPTQYEDQNNPSWWRSNAVDCPGGIVAGTPLYAFVQASGTGAQVPGLTSTAGDRTLQGLYQFETTNSFSVGGRIAEYDASGAGQRILCLDAGTNPTVNTQPTMKSCLALGTASQTWQYRTDLTIYYGGDPSLNLCITNMSGTPKLETCTSAANTPATSTYPYGSSTQQSQEWGFNDNGHLSAALSNGDVTESTGGNCLEPQGATSSTAASANAPLVITSCDAATTGYTAWNPDPQVGAGSALNYYTGANGQTKPQGVPASSPTSQFVNFAEFGRCLDVTGQNQNADHLIDYPCKQAPSSCNLTWNQVWAFSTNSSYGRNASTGDYYGEFTTSYGSGRHNCDAPGTAYCLTAPGSTSSTHYVTITPCGSTPTASQLWDATGQQASYSSSYLLVNKATGQCMAADPSIQPTYGSSTIVATACDGTGVPSGSSSKNSLLLKWNAPPDSPNYGLRNVQETSGQIG